MRNVTVARNHHHRTKGVFHNVKRPVLIGLTVGLLGALAWFSGALSSWSNRASDRLFLDEEPHPAIFIAAIDDASIARIGRWPWDRSIHADLIRKIANAGARVIAYDVNFPEPQDAENDNDLASAIIGAGNAVLPVELELIRHPSSLTYDPERTLSSVSAIAGAARRTGHTNTPPDSDGVVRRIPLLVHDPSGGGFIRAFGYEAANMADPDVEGADPPLDRFGQLIVRYPGAPRTTYETVSAADILQGSADLSVIRDRIVFVGSTAPDLHDEQITPTSMGTPMSGVEVHASLANTLLTRDWLRPAPAWLAFAILLFIGLILGFIAPLARARWGALAALAIWIAVLGSAFAAFDRGVIVDVVWPTIALVFAYAAITLERRITAEYERRKLKTLFSRYVSPSVVETILEDPSKIHLGGERKRMTVFFSDIRGFTSMSESMEPEELVANLNIYLDRMTDIVFEHEGVLDKYMGDAVMAFWNAPFDQNDHAFLAVKTALAMRKALREMNEQKAFGDYEFRIGMGLNTGDMIVGNTGGRVHTDYTVLGDSVNLASRLEGLTKEYGVDILTSQATVDELDGRILVRRLDKVAVKGKMEPVTIYEVIESMDSASVEQKEYARSFEEALDAYFGRRFDQAVSLCGAMLRERPEDKSPRLLSDRARAFLSHPPADDWDGRWVFTKK
jgi:adenylate cyclase